MKFVSRWAVVILAVALVSLVGHGRDGRPVVIPEAEAQAQCPAIDVRPDFMIIFDTSASMTQTIDADGSVVTCTANNQCLSNNCAGTNPNRFCSCTSNAQCPAQTFCFGAGTGRTGQCLRDFTFGDGSIDQPGNTSAGESRISIAKQALTNVVGAIGEVNFGLMRFHQIETYENASNTTIATYNRNDYTDFAIYDQGVLTNRCAVTSCNEELVNGTAAPGTCAACPNPTCDDLRINYVGAQDTIACTADAQCPAGMACAAFNQVCTTSLGCALGDCVGGRCAVGVCNGTPTNINFNTNCTTAGSPFSGADVLVQVGAEGGNQILPWIDGRESCTAFFNRVADRALPTEQRRATELRATGNTPLGGSLRAARDNYANVVIPGDPSANPVACAGRPAFCRRQYYVILMTDGLETCGGNPVSEAQTMFTTGVTVGGVNHKIQTFVIGLGIFGAARDSLNAIASAGGTTNAFFPTDQASLQLAFNNIIRGTIRTEVCNGIDDNCNGQIDEGVLNACGQCGPVQADFCNAAGSPVDANCDGQIDPAILNACGLCPNSPQLGPEICDGQDNDCDGCIDSTRQANGSCGPTICGQPGQSEVCNGRDDDGDGFIDVIPTATTCATNSNCIAIPNAVCQNGRCVQRLTQECGNFAQGECRTGIATCINGSYGTACPGSQDPVNETCDCRDNDCDGVVDDFQEACGACPGGVCNPPCTSGFRACTCVAQARACTADTDCAGIAADPNNPGSSVICIRTGPNAGRCGVPTYSACNNIGPAANDVCNGVDDDCDGVIDGTVLAAACVSDSDCNVADNQRCQTTQQGRRCVRFSQNRCGFCGPEPQEICNGVDDNCDGNVDETFPGKGAQCSPAVTAPDGTVICPAGTTQCCTEEQAAQGVCTFGEPFCDRTRRDTPELCNGIDDNCNGRIDESPVQGSGERCCPWLDPSGNNDPTTPCPDTIKGACVAGLTQCTGAAFACPGARGPATNPPELCNGVDDDCNGEIDDNAVCPAEQRCIKGECRVRCIVSAEGGARCPGGTACVGQADGQRFCVPSQCVDVKCKGDERCDPATGKCVDLCTARPTPCPDGTRCVGGNCQTLDCSNSPALACTDGKVCRGGRCVGDPCEENPCPDGQGCRATSDTARECFATCPVSCPDGQLCLDGLCRVDPCADVQCAGVLCVNGECDTSCVDFQCNAGSLCLNRACVADPCVTANCPAGQACKPVAVNGADGGPATLNAACVPASKADNSINVTATGGGGCTCSVADTTDPSSAAGGLALLLGLLALLPRSRRQVGGAR